MRLRKTSFLLAALIGAAFLLPLSPALAGSVGVPPPFASQPTLGTVGIPTVSPNQLTTGLAGKQANEKIFAVFGADPLGVTDATSAIQAAINQALSNGGACYIPSGTYKVNSATTKALLVSANGIHLYGAGAGVTILANSSTTGDTLLVSNSGTTTPTANVQDFSLDNMSFRPSVARGTATHELNLTSVYNYHVHNIDIEATGTSDANHVGVALSVGSVAGIATTGTPANPIKSGFGFINNVFIKDAYTGLYVVNAVDQWTTGMTIYTPNYATANAGVIYDSNVQSCNITNMDDIGPNTSTTSTGTGIGMVLQNTANTVLGFTAYNQTSASYLDSWNVGAQDTGGYEDTWTGCWMSDRGPSGFGVGLTSVTGDCLSGCTVVNNGVTGVSMSGCTRVSITGGVIGDNVQATGQTGANLASIVDFNSTHLLISGVHLGVGVGFNGTHQTTGVFVAGSSDYLAISGSDLTGNTTEVAGAPTHYSMTGGF